jgi:tRNA-2-methylthio-N6-dimethylallyladenosine synthase
MELKQKRLEEIVALQNHLSLESNKLDLGKKFEVLIEGNSKKSNQHWMGRNSQNKVVVFEKNGTILKPGDYVTVDVYDCTQGTLIGNIVS